MKTETYHIVGKNHEQRITPLLCELFGFELGYQAERMATRIRNLAGKKFSLNLTQEEKKKSRNALGFYFGGLIRAQVMDDKDLRYDPNAIPDDWKEYRRRGLVSLTDCDNTDLAFRLEFHYEWIKDLQGRPVKVAKGLAEEDNEALKKLIDNVQLWRDEQEYPKLNIDEYKKKRKMDKLTSIPKSDVQNFHKGLEVPQGKPVF